MIATEDDYDDTIVPRLQAAGADLDSASSSRSLRMMKDTQFHSRCLTIWRPHPGSRRRKARYEPDNVIVIVDPVAAYLGEKVNSNNDASVRRALNPLAQLASETGAVVLARPTPEQEQLGDQGRVSGRGQYRLLRGGSTRVRIWPNEGRPISDRYGAVEEQLGPPSGGSFTFHIEDESGGDDEIAQLHVIWDGMSDITAEDLLRKRLTAGRRSTTRSG